MSGSGRSSDNSCSGSIYSDGSNYNNSFKKTLFYCS